MPRPSPIRKPRANLIRVSFLLTVLVLAVCGSFSPFALRDSSFEGIDSRFWIVSHESTFLSHVYSSMLSSVALVSSSCSLEEELSSILCSGCLLRHPRLPDCRPSFQPSRFACRFECGFSFTSIPLFVYARTVSASSDEVDVSEVDRERT